MTARKSPSDETRAKISASIRQLREVSPAYRAKVRKAALKASQTSKANRDRDRAEVARLRAELEQLRGEA